MTAHCCGEIAPTSAALNFSQTGKGRLRKGSSGGEHTWAGTRWKYLVKRRTSMTLGSRGLRAGLVASRCHLARCCQCRQTWRRRGLSRPRRPRAAPCGWPSATPAPASGPPQRRPSPWRACSRCRLPRHHLAAPAPADHMPLSFDESAGREHLD